MNCEIVAKAPVHPTEDLDKVIEALSNVFDYDDILIAEESVTVNGNTSCLFPFKEFLEKRQIRDTARKIILKGWDEESKTINLKLSKQAAFAGMINLVDDDLSPLGEIEVKITTTDVEEFANWLCAH
ncbi:RNA-binding domain-containing protein [Methanobacterium sp.]|uniref:RNA-binding domain-containing protein n=1 Tax=Methanobacterium sp. TaxID=2164 RepID=UPI002ABB7779|nr:RNA-binding domain-containing protein [Methanobacterium sp.]MDY9922369.1 RNA-binding domain-containing protein [Methanobacterium sp.]